MGIPRINESRVYLNSLVESSEHDFYSSLYSDPVEVVILEAHFEVKKTVGENTSFEQYNTLDGLWKYVVGTSNIVSSENSKYEFEDYALGICERTAINNKLNDLLNNTTIYLMLKEVNHPEIPCEEFILDNLKDNINILRHETEGANRDSCIPLINMHAKLYRQSINGKEPIIISDLMPYNPQVHFSHDRK